MSKKRLNLRGVQPLLVDSDHFTRGLIAQMLRSFGADTSAIYDTGKAAQAHLLQTPSDLILCEATFSDMDGADFIKWVRRQDKSPMRFAPIIVLSSYTQRRHVTLARDAGANFVLTKPISPQVLFDHIVWVAKSSRCFVETKSYIGPDRRFRNVEPLDGIKKRESDFTEVNDAQPQEDIAPGEMQGQQKVAMK